MSQTKKDSSKSSSKSSSKQRSVTFDKKTKNGESKRERASTDQPQLQQHERQQVLLDPPSFRLPSLSNEENPNRYELWTVRLPAGLNLQDLQGVNLRHDETLESDGSKYLVQLGHAAENESFRVLVPEDTASNDREQDSDGDSDDSDGKNDKNNKTNSSKRHHKQQRLMVPVPQPLARHWNVVQHTVLSEAEVAPRADQAPTPCVPLRHAYSHVPKK